MTLRAMKIRMHFEWNRRFSAESGEYDVSRKRRAHQIALETAVPPPEKKKEKSSPRNFYASQWMRVIMKKEKQKKNRKIKK